MGLERSYLRAQGFGGPEGHAILAPGLDLPLPAYASCYPHIWVPGSFLRLNVIMVAAKCRPTVSPSS